MTKYYAFHVSLRFYASVTTRKPYLDSATSLDFASNQSDLGYSGIYIVMRYNVALKQPRQGDGNELIKSKTITRTEKFKTPKDALVRLNNFDKEGRVLQETYDAVYQHLLDLEDTFTHLVYINSRFSARF